MTFRGKKYRQAIALIDTTRTYCVEEATDLLERTNTVKFDPTIEIHFRLNIDPKYSDQLIRSTIILPHGSGKTIRIGAFTDSGNEDELRALGVSIAGGDDLMETVAAGKIDFDIAIATPAMMRKMGKIAKILGPKGLMPNPKIGTVGDNLIAIAKELMAGKFEFKNDKQGNVHTIVGKLSFGQKKLAENIAYFIQVIRDARPASVKTTGYIESVYVCGAMSPSIRLDIR